MCYNFLGFCIIWLFAFVGVIFGVSHVLVGAVRWLVVLGFFLLFGFVCLGIWGYSLICCFGRFIFLACFLRCLFFLLGFIGCGSLVIV